MSHLHSMIHVIEQGGHYHAVSDHGQQVCESNADLKIFAEELSGFVDRALSAGHGGEQIEVHFQKDSNVVRFIIEKREMDTRLLKMVSEVPDEEDMKVFLEYFSRIESDDRIC